MPPAARGARPVTLRDFLELGCESSSDGFRSYPRCLPCDDAAGVLQAPVRFVIEADLRRSPSWSPSSFFLPKSPGALARISSLSRSFSRRIREGFWRRREDDDEAYFDERDSCGFPSPLVSSCSASDSESEYAEWEPDVVTEEKLASAPAPECEKASSSSSSADHHCTDAPEAARDCPKEALDGDSAAGRNLEMEEKQQLSPVSVLDFPFDDDEGSDAGTCSPSFQHCPPDHQGAKAQLLHKIRRYEGLAEAVDLQARFTTSDAGESADARSWCSHLQSNSCTDNATATTASSSRHDDEDHRSAEQSEEQEPDEYRLLERLLVEDTAASAAADEISESLLLDFFAEGIDRHRSVAGTVKPLDDRKVAALVGAAGEWLRGAGPQWGIGDVIFSGEAALADMERWMCLDEDERDVSAAVSGLVMGGLVDELVTELAPWWCGHSWWS
ncbi:uncharacterized protein LOC133910854 [Phragmites australis]|uniref:uncharacterized protein LOC133910854 n=1 Tax=Phragmites australis TaxID=29695 RepID=UPI002D796078|nr:uncharacterized protein LOC133910854 [Phragmites australis]